MIFPADPLGVRMTTLCLILTSALCAAEQKSRETSQNTIDETIVTANHMPTPAQLVGSAVSVLNTEDFAKRITFDPSALFRSLPSLNLSQTGPYGGLTELRVRGSESNHTLVLIDGVEANDPANGAAFNLATLAGTAIKRIELLRGPQSARYGSEAIGGVIAIETRDGFTDDSDMWASSNIGLESGTHGFQQGHFNSRWRQTLGSARWQNQISATRALTNGSNSSFFGSESDGYQNRTWSADSSLFWRDGRELGLSVRQTYGTTDGDPQDFAFPVTPTQGLVIDGDEDNASKQRLAALRGKVRSGLWLHEFMLSQNKSSSRYRRNGLDNSGLQGSLNKAEWTTSREFSPGTVKHSLALGVQYEQRKFGNFSASLASANHKARDQQRSQFVEYLARTEQRSLSVSARHDNNQRFANLTTWRVTATQALGERMRAHTSWGEGSASPTFFELFGFIPSSFEGNPELKPETTEGWDAGLGGQLYEGRLFWDLTYFRSRLDDEIITDYGPPPSYLSRPANLDGASKRNGWELSLQGDLADTVLLDANFTWLDSIDPGGAREVRRPRRSGAINAHLGFAGDKGKASVSLVYNGAMQDSEFVSATPQTRVRIKPVTLLNLGVSYQANQRTTLFLRGQNILDKKYQQVFSFRAPGATASAGIIWSI